MTERLYYANAYLKEFEATVVGHADGGRVYLDRSAFYPTSGGQPFDVGSLRATGLEGSGRLPVLDVVDEGERVAHVLEQGDAQRLVDGQRVSGQLDWLRRFDHMQQHSGQHLLSAVFQELLGLATLSVHFGVDAATLDLETGSLAPEQLIAVEERANAIVFDNRSVTAEEDGNAEGLRKQSARTGPLRIVTIAALDRSACGGTHVAKTGEIGPILLGKIERVRKATRVEFVCGGRALRRARTDREALGQLGGLLSTSIEGVVEVTRKRLAELERDSKALRAAQATLDEYRAHELYAIASGQLVDGVALHVERRAQGPVQELHGLAQAFIGHPRAVFIALSDEPASILLATSEDTAVNAGALLKDALGRAGGRGGGSARLAQGTVKTATALVEVLASVRSALAAGVALRPE